MSRDLSIQKNTLELTSLYNKDTEAYQSHVSHLKDNCNTTLIVENYALVTVEMPEILRRLSCYYYWRVVNIFIVLNLKVL